MSEWAEADGHGHSGQPTEAREKKKKNLTPASPNRIDLQGSCQKEPLVRRHGFWLGCGMASFRTVCLSCWNDVKGSYGDAASMYVFPPLGRGFLVQRVPRVTFARALDGQSKRWDLSEIRCGGERLVVVLFRNLFERWLVKIMTILRRLRPGLAD